MSFLLTVPIIDTKYEVLLHIDQNDPQHIDHESTLIRKKHSITNRSSCFIVSFAHGKSGETGSARKTGETTGSYRKIGENT